MWSDDMELTSYSSLSLLLVEPSISNIIQNVNCLPSPDAIPNWLTPFKLTNEIPQRTIQNNDSPKEYLKEDSIELSIELEYRCQTNYQMRADIAVFASIRQNVPDHSGLWSYVQPSIPK
ncbi:10712_t:CDS:2 [Acaulospora morrowiae]|uniref:10712_t:CDS:1 n=1 Tax=Acaulospora morrowiae TaxID=94023 RepID=A0A9N9N9A3_9GLOM|nr:10712_t:CDS:2 [Acaulospora morrowiae]